MREEAGLGRTPQLLIYRVDKDSTGESKLRGPLSVPADLIGISVWIPDPVQKDPGDPAAGPTRRSYVTHVQVRIPDELRSMKDDANEDEDVAA